MNDLTETEARDLVKAGHMDRFPVGIIAHSAHAASKFAQRVGLTPQQFVWLSGPNDLDGRRGMTVMILPNWWRHDYGGMEEALQRNEVRVITVHFGRKPNYKNRPYLLRH